MFYKARSIVTDFGKDFWPSLTGIRALGSAFALAVASIVQLFLPAYPLQPILIILAFELVASLFIRVWHGRIPLTRLVHVTLWMDTAVITAIVFYIGGIEAGLPTLYAWTVIIAAVLLGLRWIPFYAAVALGGFAIAWGLEALGIRAAGASPQPPLITFLSQLTLLAIVIGFIYLLSTSIYGIANRLHREQIESAARREELAQQATSALEKATLLAQAQKRASENDRLYQDAQRRLRETQALYEFTTSLGQALDPEKLARRALDSVARLIDFDIAEVSLVDEPSGMIFPLAFAGRGLSQDLGGEFRAALHAHSLRRGLGVIGWTAEHGELVRLGDATRDPRYLPLSPRVRSEICVPLREGSQTIGVINLESERYDAFDERTEQILTTFAHALAVAFVNARLYGQTKREAEVKAAILRELSHRVKNNLAAIASLLYLALDEPPESREGILMETLGRVESMVLAHTLLTRSDHARVDLLDLGRQALNDTVRQLSPPRSEIQVSVEGDSLEVSPRQITTLALVLNELATNAIQHGLADPEFAASGQLRLHIEREGYGAILTLEDNGVGLPNGFAAKESAGLGLRLVRTLVEKDLQGRFELERRGDRTCAIVKFLVED